MEKTYRVVGNTGRWAVAEDDAKPAGNYATREGALEVIYWRHPMISRKVSE
jgi:hypothetical protein